MFNKVGQKAKIVNALRLENIGLVVTPIRSLGFYNKGESLWISGESFCCIVTDNFWLVESPMGVETMFGGALQAYIPDTWLSPLVPERKEVESKKADFA